MRIENPDPLYRQAYRKRHHIDKDVLEKSAMLDLAAFLEHQALLSDDEPYLAVYKARKAFVAEYPHSNRIHCTCIRNKCNMICKFSVLSLIKEYDVVSKS